MWLAVSTPLRGAMMSPNAIRVSQSFTSLSSTASAALARWYSAALTDSRFYRIQVPGSEDEGRYLVTGDEADRFAFKTPTLRNIAVTYPYMNNGATATLEEAVEIMGREMLGREYSSEEVDDLVAFLHTLTGEMPSFQVPALP